MKLRFKNTTSCTKYYSDPLKTCLLLLAVIICYGACNSELESYTFSTEAPVTNDDTPTTTVDPFLDPLISDMINLTTNVPITLVPEEPSVLNSSKHDPAIETSGDNGQENNNVTSEQNLDKVGHVKRRAIRSLMKIFGLPDDAVFMREGNQFGPAPEFMISLYNTITDSSGVTRAKNPYGAHVIRSFMERDSSKYDFFYFNLTASGKLKETERVVEAELHLYRNPTPHDRLHPSLYLTPFYILSLYQVVDSRNLGIPDLHKLLGVHYVPALGSGWAVFNVTQTIVEWLKGEKQNLGFIVAATSLGGDRVPVTFSRRSETTEGEKSNKQPILVLFNHDSEVEKLNMIQPPQPSYRMNRAQSERSRNSKENDDGNEEGNSAPILPNIPTSSLENPRFHHSLLYQDTIRHPNSVSRFRSRRSKNQTEHGETNDTSTVLPKNLTSCSKHDLFISFETIGWASWIISPKGYNAYYCTGPCVFPLSHEVTPTNHATLQSIAHELSLSSDVGRPCCVPTKLLPISLLYYDDDDNVVLKQYVDMVADTCGCH